MQTSPTTCPASRTAGFAYVALAGVLALSACKKKEEPPVAETPTATTAPEVVDTRPTQIDLSGPRPPEVSAVFFGVNGALIPLACFDAASKSIKAGPDCFSLVPAGAEVYLSSETGNLLDTVGAAKNAMCELADKPTSYATATLESGQSFARGAWPKTLGSTFRQIATKTTSPGEAALQGDLKTSVDAWVEKNVKGGHGPVRSNQRAAADIDGDGKDEVFVSLSVAHETDVDQVVFSGLLMAPAGDTNNWQVVDASKKRIPEVITLRGLVDLDGNGQLELWTSLTFDGGAGERLVLMEGGKAKPLGKWSCGA